MKLGFRFALLIAAVLATSSCKQVQMKLKEFAESGAEEVDDGGEVVSQEVSGFGVSGGGLPVLTSFRTVTAGEFQRFIGSDDRLAVVEFYADW
ncbi:MAG: hypothetical protein AAGC74_06205 [Verrucomicrobiota bacterium]